MRPQGAPRPTSPGPSLLPLAEAARRLRRPPGRPRKPRAPDSQSEAPSSAASKSASSQRIPLPDKASVPGMCPRLVGVHTASLALGVSVWTVRALIDTRTLPRVVLPGVRRLLVDMVDIQNLIARAKRP